MAIKIKSNNGIDIDKPTFVLLHRYGKRIGAIQARNIVYKKALAEHSELSFKVYKDDNEYWDDIKDFEIVWCKEWNKYFEIYVSIDQNNDLVKSVTSTSLGEAELSQVMVYNLEVNTEADREREDYKTTYFYNDDPDVSLLDKVLQKAPHYTITHVDNSLQTIEKTFSFDNVSIYDAFTQIAQEINCLFVLDVKNDNTTNTIIRNIEVYDLESFCMECGHRGEFLGDCPSCGGDNIARGYGSDTSIFVNAENLADTITYTCNTDNVKNCFKLVGGDDTMTQAITDCNPNGNYIWYFSDSLKESMSDDLVIRLHEYEIAFDHYQNEHDIVIPSTYRQSYNALATKFDCEDKQIEEVVEGYAGLMRVFYNSLDLQQYISSGIMPDETEPQPTTASAEASKLISFFNANQIGVKKISSTSDTSATSAVIAMAKTVISRDYEVTANEVTYNKDTGRYQAKFIVENKDDATDRYTTASKVITIVQDQRIYTEQLIHKELFKMSKKVNVTGLFEGSNAAFDNALPDYCLDYLYTLLDDAQDIVNLLVQEGIGNQSAWRGQAENLYNYFYTPYYYKLRSVKAAIKTRQNEIDTIINLQNVLNGFRSEIQDILNLENYLGSNLWREFCSYRRESTFKNDKYTSDGLTNAEIIGRALEFVARANKEIYKSAVLQHSITASVKNLLAMNEFKPLIDSFEVGNWLRLRVDDNIYRLRLLNYSIDYENLNNIAVTFSDVTANYDGHSDLQNTINSAKTMATTYDSVSRQAAKGDRSNALLNNWVERGLSVTNTRILNNADEQTQTWDSHGMLFRRYNEVNDDYEDTQLKIVNSTLAITDDNWNTVKTAIGGFYYYNTVTQQMEYAYGVNAETVVGKLILGEQMQIVNAANSMTFDESGLKVTSPTASFKLSLNDNNLLTLSNATENVFYIDSNGVLHIKGDGAGLDLTNNHLAVQMNEQGVQITALDGKIDDLGDDLSDLETDLNDNYYTKSQITVLNNGIVTSVSNDYNGKFTTVNQKLNSITTTVSDGSGSSTTTLTANAVKLAWNKISQNIKFEGTYSGAQMNIYNSSNQILMRIDTNGQHFYHKGSKIGKIGTNNWHDDSNFKGLVFDLEDSAKYMTWAVNDADNTSDYICKLIYLKAGKTIEYKDSNNNVTDRITYASGLHFWDKTYANGNLYLDGTHRFIRFRKESGTYKTDDGVGYNGRFAFCTSSYNSSTHTTSYTTYFDFEGRKFTAYNNASINFYSNLNMNGFSILNQSDVRLKKNLAPTQINALDLVNAVDMYEFKWIQDDKFVPIGIMAQQLQQVAPQLVGTDENGYLYIKTTDMVMYLWKAIQELSTGTYTKAPFNESDYIKVRPDIAPTGSGGEYEEYSDDGEYVFPPIIINGDDDEEEETNE